MSVQWRGVRRIGGPATLAQGAPGEMKYRRERPGLPGHMLGAKPAQIVGSVADSAADLSAHVPDLGGEVGEGNAAGSGDLTS